MRDRSSGFTLVEVLVALAVVSILVTIAMPSFIRESRKSRVMAEVQPLFSDIRLRLEVFLQENGRFPASTGEIPLHPPGAPSGAAQAALNPLPAEWQALRIRVSGIDEVYCRYTWSTGLANQGGNIGAEVGAAPPAGFGFAAPTVDWYYVLARCDMNGDGVQSLYLTTSLDPRIRKINEGG